MCKIYLGLGIKSFSLLLQKSRVYICVEFKETKYVPRRSTRPVPNSIWIVSSCRPCRPGSSTLVAPVVGRSYPFQNPNTKANFSMIPRDVLKYTKSAVAPSLPVCIQFVAGPHSRDCKLGSSCPGTTNWEVGCLRSPIVYRRPGLSKPAGNRLPVRNTSKKY